MSVGGWIVLGFCSFMAFQAVRAFKRHSRYAYINSYRFHPAIRGKVQERHPSLTKAQLDLVFKALRDYFHCCNKAGRNLVSMPSQVVDDAWHEFILFTRAYQNFCQKGLGRFLHHTPAQAMKYPTMAQEGIKRAWRVACHHEGISLKQPDRLPLLFAIDAQLNISNGFRYVLDCQSQSSPLNGGSYCASHIGCSSGCAGGGTSCSGDGGDGSGCGGGD